MKFNFSKIQFNKVFLVKKLLLYHFCIFFFFCCIKFALLIIIAIQLNSLLISNYNNKCALQYSYSILNRLNII